MKIKEVQISHAIERKIFKKHRISLTEIEWALLNTLPRYWRTRNNAYMAIAHTTRYLTIIFSYKKSTARIIIAYPASRWQIKLYKK